MTFRTSLQRRVPRFCGLALVAAVLVSNCRPFEEPAAIDDDGMTSSGGRAASSAGGDSGDDAPLETGGLGPIGGRLGSADGGAGGSDGTMGGAGAAAIGGAAGGLNTLDHEFCIDDSRGTLTVLFLIDTSLSMGELLPGSSQTRLSYAQAEIQQALLALPDSVHAGILPFPNVPDAGPVSPECFVPEEPPLLSLGEERADLETHLKSLFPEGTSPTIAAHEYAADVLRATSAPDPKVIVLVTDGVPNVLPDCSEIPAETVPYEPLVESVQAAQSDGIATLVVAIPQSDDLVPMLTEVATRGRNNSSCSASGQPACFLDLGRVAPMAEWLLSTVNCK